LDEALGDIEHSAAKDGDNRFWLIIFARGHESWSTAARADTSRK
jgi:hypothetical protein